MLVYENCSMQDFIFEYRLKWNQLPHYLQLQHYNDHWTISHGKAWTTKKNNGNPFSWGSSGRPLGPVLALCLARGRNFLLSQCAWCSLQSLQCPRGGLWGNVAVIRKSISAYNPSCSLIGIMPLPQWFSFSSKQYSFVLPFIQSSIKPRGSDIKPATISRAPEDSIFTKLC